MRSSRARCRSTTRTCADCSKRWSAASSTFRLSCRPTAASCSAAASAWTRRAASLCAHFTPLFPRFPRNLKCFCTVPFSTVLRTYTVFSCVALCFVPDGANLQTPLGSRVCSSAFLLGIIVQFILYIVMPYEYSTIFALVRSSHKCHNECSGLSESLELEIPVCQVIQVCDPHEYSCVYVWVSISG